SHAPTVPKSEMASPNNRQRRFLNQRPCLRPSFWRIKSVQAASPLDRTFYVGCPIHFHPATSHPAKYNHSGKARLCLMPHRSSVRFLPDIAHVRETLAPNLKYQPRPQQLKFSSFIKIQLSRTIL